MYYDSGQNCLVFDRKLREGDGSKSYGLEIAKSLNMPADFMESAFSIRNKYFPEMRGELSHKTSKYNSQKIRGKCEMCRKELSSEVHHIEPQKKADKEGIIRREDGGVFHKNIAGNLMALCEGCHLKQHKK